ncbi:uncharacterized protein K460DRAFT_123523 [Cucurbitaria berberidis CBS 394.84]|uniref:Uncharacterized protein n=1 Tax=Cucurbitaria berberidis CBS 394.84 TaxID=1168544 RepID=A0A9P4GJH8_9PLEO|nr:uncharacterized protein K460DRAFT_123523 [Cucurbitaria berberidis CBS 394.84]KAF1846354.1 hypothetical protein K460DRAFT_123523 [Cucurbitaria berberidis CBS 394.84]
MKHDGRVYTKRSEDAISTVRIGNKVCADAEFGRSGFVALFGFWLFRFDHKAGLSQFETGPHWRRVNANREIHVRTGIVGILDVVVAGLQPDLGVESRDQAYCGDALVVASMNTSNGAIREEGKLPVPSMLSPSSPVSVLPLSSPCPNASGCVSTRRRDCR